MVRKRGVPNVAQGRGIPKLIHQVFFMPDGSPPDIPLNIRDNIDSLIRENPAWQHQLYDLPDMEAFIGREYGPDMLRVFRTINPEYGAARADLFRYLLMYRVGGVYLDVKSGTSRPLDEIVRPGDQYILAQWDNGDDDPHPGWGLHAPLAEVAGGEFQQWHIICAPGHPFLRAVIQIVVRRIKTYALWRDDVGWNGVLRLTGPIPYTLAIAPMLARYRHRKVDDQREIGLRYSTLEATHHNLFGTHYVEKRAGIIVPQGIRRVQTDLFLAARTLKKRIRQPG